MNKKYKNRLKITKSVITIIFAFQIITIMM